MNWGGHYRRCYTQHRRVFTARTPLQPSSSLFRNTLFFNFHFYCIFTWLGAHFCTRTTFCDLSLFDYHPTKVDTPPPLGGKGSGGAGHKIIDALTGHRDEPDGSASPPPTLACPCLGQTPCQKSSTVTARRRLRIRRTKMWSLPSSVNLRPLLPPSLTRPPPPRPSRRC